MTRFRSILSLCLLVSLLFFTVCSSAAFAEKQKTLFRGMTYNGTSTQDLVELQALGANVLAYQIVWPGTTSDSATVTEYQEWLNGQLTVLDGLLAGCETLGLKVLIVLHTPPGGFFSRSTPSEHRIFRSATFRAALLATWQEIATRYANSAAVYGFDLLNEPATGPVNSNRTLWNPLAAELAAIVRAAAPNQRIVIEPVYGNPDLFGKLTAVSVSNVIYSYHSYFSARFRNQGTEGRPINVPYPKGKFNRGALINSVKGAVRFAKKNKVKILVGEFAAPRWAPKNSAYRYLRDSISIFEKNRWDWINHGWREADVWSIEHGTNPNDPNPSATQTDREKLFIRCFAKNA